MLETGRLWPRNRTPGLSQARTHTSSRTWHLHRLATAECKRHEKSHGVSPLTDMLKSEEKEKEIFFLDSVSRFLFKV